MAAVNVATYLQRKSERLSAQPHSRAICWTCRQAGAACYCAYLKPFETDVHFVILIHPIEVKRRVATGRMAHLCLKNSTLIEGEDFSTNSEVLSIVEDQRNHCVVLYPGRYSKNLTRGAKVSPEGKRLVIFVIDGTWNTAGRMIRSSSLRDLPKVSFDPVGPSTFRVRKQPAPECLSTIEAIHHTIGLLEENKDRRNLLDVFDRMVSYQLSFTSDIAEARKS